MNHRDPERGEPDLDDMLRVLAHHDARVTAPVHLHDAVMAAWDARHAASTTPGRWVLRWRAPLTAAAALVIAVSWLVAHLADGRATDRGNDAVDAHSYFAPTGDAAMSALVGEPALDTESLQLVRVRMPRGALRAFGVALLDPDATSDVEVDVLVGDDGFPRSIQRVRPMPDSAQERRP